MANKPLNLLMKIFYLNRRAVRRVKTLNQAICQLANEIAHYNLPAGSRESPQLSGVAHGLLLQHANLVERSGIRRLKPDLIYEKIRPQINVRR
jgi:hypothetical protein